MAFSLGLTIAQTHLKMRIKILAVAIFSIASPIGIAIGIGVTDMQEVWWLDTRKGRVTLWVVK